MLDSELLKGEGLVKSVDCSEKGVRGVEYEGREGTCNLRARHALPTTPLTAFEYEFARSGQ
jgi:hypothetical protein